MPVNSQHPLYAANYLTWKTCRDAVEGERAVKAGGELYLPRLEDQSAAEYVAYKTRASFYGAVGRTVKGLTGAVMRKPFDLQFPGKTADSNPPLLETIGGAGQSLQAIVQMTLDEVVGVGRVGLLVDSPEGGGDPFVKVYYAENVLNWEETSYAGQTFLTLLVLQEDVLVEAEDERGVKDRYQKRVEQQWRVYELQDWEAGRPKVEVSVWRRAEDARKGVKSANEEFELVSPPVVLKYRGGKLVPYVPFRFINAPSTTCAPEKPPLEDLVNVNLSHYRNSADLEHGLHFTALPTAVAVGFELKDGAILRVGSSVAWVSENPQAKAFFNEFSGAGLSSIRETMADKEKQMAVLGARMLEQPKADAEAAAAVALRQAGERSVLATIAGSVSEGVSDVLEWVRDWAGLTGDASVWLNQDFDASGIDPLLLANLVAAVQANLMSYPVFYYILERAELYPDGHSLEKESTLIAAGPPVPAAGPPDAGQGVLSTDQGGGATKPPPAPGKRGRKPANAK